MKNKIKKLLAFAAASILTFSALACADNKQSDNTKKEPTNITEETPHGDVENCTHIYNIGGTVGKFLENGVSDYKIVVPENCGMAVLRAGNEFRSFFKDATGFNFDVVNDSAVEYNANSKYLVLGDVSFAKNINYGFDASILNTSSYIIKTVGKSVFVKGGGDYGVLYGAYELLHQMLNYEIYALDTIVYDKNVKNIDLKDYSICDVADIEFNTATYAGGGYTSVINAHRMRTYSDSEMWIPDTQCHDIFRLLNPADYYDEHPTWYSGDKSQLCYTANGDEVEYEALVSTMVEVLKEKIDGSSMSNLSITQNDIAVWCTCDKCTEYKNKYGAESATHILFTNEVAKRIEKWLNEERDGRKINIAIFAYHKTEMAPVKLVNGEYVPTADEMRLRDNVSIWYAPAMANFSSSIYSLDNISTYTIMKQWTACTKTLFCWFYDANFSYYLVPYATISPKQDWYKFAKECGAKYMFNQGIWNSTQHTGFSNLKVYLNTKLGWNVNTDVSELMDNFFDNYFGAASTAMRDLFNQMEAVLYLNKGQLGSIYSQSRSSKIWSKPVLMKFLTTIDQAYEAIEKIKDSDSEKYQLYYDHINLESICARYLLNELYGSSFDEATLKDLKYNLGKDMENLGITRLSEGGGSSVDYIRDLMG